MDRGPQDFDRRLLHGQVGHLNIETVVVDSLDALANVVGQAGLAELVETIVVWDCTSLMELPEEIVEVNDGSRIIDESFPVSADLA